MRVNLTIFLALITISLTFKEISAQTKDVKSSQGWSIPKLAIKNSNHQFPTYNINLAENRQGVYIFGNSVPRPGKKYHSIKNMM
ncbi:hypothetical protein NC796_04640 [Aliifodinibius sp. S!AR15-10]|uniref:hypothetical protein n=1 Tax=Aliifodinibius sp. S!AR15-10 TaxID=2950437 RepID=UPI002854BB4E|nr:hypothetical protein [Aliifodinibius sp. S!AR15-10]MDR8390418.1 hypothetical protein [Aliifodinibius sp. S!AR15-10]